MGQAGLEPGVVSVVAVLAGGAPVAIPAAALRLLPEEVARRLDDS
jgi:hypothetical protein